MTEYELADLLASFSGDTLVYIPLFISILSGYLVVAWLVGNRLTRAQVVLINALYIAVLLLLGASWAKRVSVALSYQRELIAMNPRRVEVMGDWLIPIVTLIAIAFLIGSLKFMWDIRHPKTE
jgi:hypothetical protein